MIIAELSTKEVINSHQMNFDYIIVGQGIAGTVLAHSFRKEGYNVLIVDNGKENTSSKVAAGLFNPVTGKRVVKTWLADTIFPFAATFYTQLEKELKAKFYHSKDIYKPYQSIEEQNDVISKTAENRLSPYIKLNSDLVYDNKIKDELGAITISKSGHLDTVTFLSASKDFFKKESKYLCSEIDMNDFSFNENSVCWKNYTAKKIIFSEGYLAKFNPLWSWLPFSVTKGEMLEVSIENFPDEHIVNKGAFILPKGNGTYLAGSSYEHSLDETTTEKGKKIVEDKLSNILHVPYKIIGQRAAIRPTVRDRRPYLGIHPKHQHFAIFNGLGTKGVTLGPYFANEFVNFLEKEGELNKEVNINRYLSLYTELEKND